MLDTTTWPGRTDNDVDALVWLVRELLVDPNSVTRVNRVDLPITASLAEILRKGAV